jgi:hypothetical protein
MFTTPPDSLTLVLTLRAALHRRLTGMEMGFRIMGTRKIRGSNIIFSCLLHANVGVGR